MNFNTDFPGNAFVARSYPPPQAAQAVSLAEPPAGDVDSAEAAQIIGVTENNLRQMIHLKKLRPVGKRGRRNVFSRADVERIRDERKS